MAVIWVGSVSYVIGRTMHQIKLLNRKGLRDVMVWPLLTSRRDVVPPLFPKMAEMQYTPQVSWQFSFVTLFEEFACNFIV